MLLSGTADLLGIQGHVLDEGEHHLVVCFGSPSGVDRLAAVAKALRLHDELGPTDAASQCHFRTARASSRWVIEASPVPGSPPGR